MTTDKLGRRIRELELIVAVYSAALELYKEKEKGCATNTPRPHTGPYRNERTYANGSSV